MLVAGRGLAPVDTALATLSATAGNASALVLTAFQLGQQVALRCIAASDVGLETMTGWSITNGAGAYGTDYLLRARESTPGLCWHTGMHGRQGLQNCMFSLHCTRAHKPKNCMICFVTAWSTTRGLET